MSALKQRDLAQATQGLTAVDAWAGLRLTVFNLVVLNALLLATFCVPGQALFLVLAVITGLFYTSVMMTTHDAIHHTLTGWYVFDEVAPRVFSWFIFWPHGLYAELHKLHHKLNGRDVSDPENPTATLDQWRSSGAFGRTLIRHQWWLALFVYGGFGMIVRHVREGCRRWPTDAAIRRAMLIDLAGIAAAAVVTLSVIAWYGVTWKYAVYLLVVERLLGFFQQLRSHIEHYGLWGAPGSLIEARLYNCRNISTLPLVSRFFNGLNFHSVHHAFPKIPYYHLPTAHARIAALCTATDRPLPVGEGYLKTLLQLAAAPRLIGEAETIVPAYVKKVS